MSQSRVKGKIRIVVYEEIAQDLYKFKASKVVNTLNLEDNQVHIKKQTYIVDTSFVKKFDNKGYPILEYYRGNSLPITENITPTNDNKPANVDHIKTLNGFGKAPSSTVWYEMFRRQKLKAILSSATKAKEAAPWYIYLMLGVMVGLVVGIIAYPYLFPATIVHNTPTGVITH